MLGQRAEAGDHGELEHHIRQQHPAFTYNYDFSMGVNHVLLETNENFKGAKNWTHAGNVDVVELRGSRSFPRAMPESICHSGDPFPGPLLAVRGELLGGVQIGLVT